MRYFYVVSQHLTPERFTDIQEIRKTDVGEYEKKEGYVKKVTQKQALTDTLLRKHFTLKQIEESYEK